MQRPVHTEIKHTCKGEYTPRHTLNLQFNPGLLTLKALDLNADVQNKTDEAFVLTAVIKH